MVSDIACRLLACVSGLDLRELIVPTTAGTLDDQFVLVLECSVLPDHRTSREYVLGRLR
jgi:hypothetical protein